MKISKKLFISIFLMVCISPGLCADREGSIRALFTWAEENHSNLFIPSPALVQKSPPWSYVYYQNTNTYIGVNDKDLVWVLGDVFGGLLYIGTLNEMLDEIGYIEDDSPKNQNVPFAPHPTIPNAFVVKQKTNWFWQSFSVSSPTRITLRLNPDGFGEKSIINKQSGVLIPEINLPNPDWHSRQQALWDEIKYHIEIRDGKEYIVFNQTGAHTLFLDGVFQEYSTNKIGPQRESLFFNDRINISFKLYSISSEEVLEKEKK